MSRLKDRTTKTEYKNVYSLRSNWGGGNIFSYSIQINKHIIKSASKQYATAKEAALALDKKLIELGYEPINILVKKT